MSTVLTGIFLEESGGEDYLVDHNRHIVWAVVLLCETVSAVVCSSAGLC